MRTHACIHTHTQVHAHTHAYTHTLMHAHARGDRSCVLTQEISYLMRFLWPLGGCSVGMIWSQACTSDLSASSPFHPRDPFKEQWAQVEDKNSRSLGLYTYGSFRGWFLLGTRDNVVALGVCHGGQERKPTLPSFQHRLRGPENQENGSLTPKTRV